MHCVDPYLLNTVHRLSEIKIILSIKICLKNNIL